MRYFLLGKEGGAGWKSFIRGWKGGIKGGAQRCRGCFIHEGGMEGGGGGGGKNEKR